MLIGVFHTSLTAQTNSESKKSIKTAFYDLRGSNVLDIGVGTAVINGDLIDPQFEMYFHVGYIRYLIPNLNVNVIYNKFYLV